MTDRLVIQKEEETELKKQLDNIDWPIDYGNIRVQLRNGKATLVTIEKTIKLD